MPITLNHSNINVQYSTGSNYIIETVKSDLYIRDSRTSISSNLTGEPTVIFPTFTETIKTFQHSGGTENQTTTTITLGLDTICDILIVGGGGSGDRQIGGGGGGGAVLYATNITIPAGSYTIKVGKGGENGNGGNSEAFGAICLGGGSTTFVAWATANNGSAGGSGSGGSPGTVGQPTATGGSVGTSTKGSLLNSGTLYNGNPGGNALPQISGVYHVGGGGGGGAGTAGFNSTQTAYTTRSTWIAAGKPSNGGDGVPINITGTTYYWGAGGGGVGHLTHAGDGGLGGGGGGGSAGSIAGLTGTGGINNGSDGLNTGTENGGNGGAGTGSGGGGGGYNSQSATYNAGNGGSGIVIIKFKTIVNAAIPEGNPITHKTLNFTYDNNLLVYDFTNQNTEATWKAYAATIPNFTYSLNAFLTSFDPDAVWTGDSVVGWVQMTLPSTHNFLTITYGLGTWSGAPSDNIVRLLINGVQKSSATLNDRTKTYSQAYNVGDVVRIEETFATMSANFIFQFTNTNTDQYTLNFPVPTTTDILERTAGRGILNNSNLILQGTYDINLTASSTTIVPRTGQYLPFTATSNLSQNIGFRYHLLNPIKMPEGAQWTYSSNNANVYHLGNVGIGTTNPSYNLHVDGTIFTSTGGYTQTGLTTWTVMSDRRIKDNIIEASYDKCLDNVKNIDLYSFNFKDNCVHTNDKNQLGFIAQEVQQVYPKAVEVGRMLLNTNETINDVLTLNTTQIDYTLYGAVKYLIEKVEMLEQKLEKKNIITNSSNISTNSSNVITNNSNVITNSSNVITNSSNVSTNSSNVITNSSNVSTNSSNSS